MKRGFLNTARSKRVIEEAYAPQAPPGGPDTKPQRRPQKKSKSSPSPEPHTTRDVPVADSTDTVVVTLDVERPRVQEVYADGRVVAVRVTRSQPNDAANASPDPHAMDTVEEVYADDGVVAVRLGQTSPQLESTDPEKGRKKIVFDIDAPSDKAGDDDPYAVRPRLLKRHRRGWGRDPVEEFFHTVPSSHGGPSTKRAIFRFWPREPDGKPLQPGHWGTLSPDGYPWGATLYDLYIVHRVPDVTGMVSFMTGSGLREAMVAMGELDAAASEIEWAASEGRPRVEGAADTEELIRCVEARVVSERGVSLEEEGKGCEDGVVGQPPMPDAGDHDESKGKDKDKDKVDDNEYIPPPPTISVTSPFHPSHYPKPWPFTPFDGDSTLILLQERIPLYLLPQTLYVHDPFCLLTMRHQRFCNASWTSQRDIVRTYNLQITESVRLEVEEAKRKAEELEEFKARTLIILRYQRTKEQIRNYEPIIEVPLPPYPRRPTSTEEAHLYLSPVGKVGEGHHSVVYKGEWELPRELFVKQKLCRSCFQESADEEIQRLKDTGRWAKLLRAGSWGPNGFTGYLPTEAELAAVNDPPVLEKDGEVIEREITCIVPHDAAPSDIVDILDETDTWGTMMKQKERNALHIRFTTNEEESDDCAAIIRVNPPFSYESQEKSCTHRQRTDGGPVPRTAKFTVVAKLSLEYDSHLVREGNNYHHFPERFFHHYNGYTIMSQLHSVVPVNAVVPQFYGYYTVLQDGEKHPKEPSYLSPILLLEHCGQPINPDELSVEDQEECVSLLLRFQKAGWLHDSVAPRNFLVQRGKPTEFPRVRECKPELSFRLIDFGRSRKYEAAREKRIEEMTALKMFVKLGDKMGITLAV